MIGIIITGHGNFASGLNSSLELIAGKQENVHLIDFVQELSPEDLQAKIVEAIESMKSLSGILVLSDLAGGSPMKMAAMASINYSHVAVVAGTNLPMVIEASLTKDFQDDVFAFANQLVQTGKDGVVLYQSQTKTQSVDEDGI